MIWSIWEMVRSIMSGAGTQHAMCRDAEKAKSTGTVSSTESCQQCFVSLGLSNDGQKRVWRSSVDEQFRDLAIGAAPRYGYYGGYFAPAPIYPSASLWLTDYMISKDLADNYAAGQEAGTLAQAQPQDNASPELTPEVKQMISNEVQNRINLENTEAQTAPNADADPGSSGIARMLGDGHVHVFVVSSSLDVIDDSGSECALSDGDALGLSSQPPPDATAVPLVVLSSIGSRECAKSVKVTVALNDLQEMQNHMRATIDRGLGELQANQGKGGLPTAPPSAQAAPTKAAFADLAPPPDPNDANDINQQLIAADQAEKDVTSQAAASASSNNP
jgi:hypothetical protein